MNKLVSLFAITFLTASLSYASDNQGVADEQTSETPKTLMTGPVGWLAVDENGNPCVIPSAGTTATAKTLMAGSPVGWLVLTANGVAVVTSTLQSDAAKKPEENS